jgi:hypothetical protein
LFFATSPDLRGLLVAERSLDELAEAVPQAIKDLFAADGIEMIVTRAAGDSSEFRLWIATPVSVARAAMRREMAQGASAATKPR